MANCIELMFGQEHKVFYTCRTKLKYKSEQKFRQMSKHVVNLPGHELHEEQIVANSYVYSTAPCTYESKELFKMRKSILESRVVV